MLVGYPFGYPGEVNSNFVRFSTETSHNPVPEIVILSMQEPSEQYSFPEQARAVEEQLQALRVVSQIVPLDGSEHDSVFSEHRHSPRIGSQYDPLIRDSHELACPHLQTPPMQDSPVTLHDVELSPPQYISIVK